jgi:DNA polymerase III delta prime subunit
MLPKEEQIRKIIKFSNQPVLICPESRFDHILEGVVEELNVSVSDLIIFEPSEGIEPLREKFNKIFIRPHSSEFKLFVIRSVDKLSSEQANTLLKVLEEPPVYARILLSADNISSVIRTIKSRVKSVILSSDLQINERESALIGWFGGSFSSYLKEIAKLEDDEILSELNGGLEDCRRKGLNELNSELFKSMAQALSLISNTNVNRKLLLEKLYWEVKEKRK